MKRRGRGALTTWLAVATAIGLLQLPALVFAERPDGTPEEWRHPHGDEAYGMLLIDQLEYGVSDGHDVWRWDIDGWLGTDVHRLVLKSEGERSASGDVEGEAEAQLLYARPLSPYWDLQLGLRQDVLFGPGTDRERTFAVLALEGLAPQWIELETSLFVSDDGDASLRVEAVHDLYITQRLVAQTRAELDAAFSDATRFGVRSGLGELELGLRLRYEMRRELAPYVGINWTRKLGGTADLARDSDEETDDFEILAGIRLWF